ncbi:thiamine diphosphokinase [Chungangia koreensis]|uniref:Thiamine diphosphokinase n=1 Tax=Chungangia koreensis TaxID=752657 RepID=A0ABV8X1P3_9LACT
MTVVVICAGGPEELLMNFKPHKEKGNLIYIGADRGSIHLLTKGITPDHIVGDFDSVNQKEWTTLRERVSSIEKLPVEKDETDTEAAVRHAVEYKPEKLILTGVTGGRIDHFLSALHLMLRVQKRFPRMEVLIRDQGNEMHFLFPGVHQLTSNSYKYISFFSFGEVVEDVTLRGFKYEIEHECIKQGMTKFTSNEFASDVCTISFSSGICLVIRGTDV